jgi:hypothetical protein
VIIVLCVIGGLLLLIGGCVATCTVVVARKAKAYGADASQHPELTALSLAAAVHPGIEVVSKDKAADTITLRNKKTGETVTLDLNDLSTEKATQSMERFARGIQGARASAAATTPAAESDEEDAPAARSSSPAAAAVSSARAAAQAATLKKFPSFVPTYRGGQTMEASINSFGALSIGSYTFSTTDAPNVVAEFYEKKLSGLGFTVLTNASGSNDDGATASLIMQRPDPQAAVTVSAEAADSKTHVTVGFTQSSGN